MTWGEDERPETVSGCFFEDIIDGYFPLQTSLAQMMQRNGFEMALLSLSHAPIIDVPGLPHDAPVPLNIRDGRAGMIDQMAVWAWWSKDELKIAGDAEWRFWAGQESGVTFDPMTRLAEPVVVSGLGVFQTGEGYSNLQKSNMTVRQASIEKLNTTRSGPGRGTLDLTGPKWANAVLWGPRPTKGGIIRPARDPNPVCRRLDGTIESLEVDTGMYLLTDAAENPVSQSSVHSVFSFRAFCS